MQKQDFPERQHLGAHRMSSSQRRYMTCSRVSVVRAMEGAAFHRTVWTIHQGDETRHAF